MWSKISTALSMNYGMEAEELFAHPELYRGKSKERAVEIADRYENKMNKLTEQLEKDYAYEN